MFAAKGELKKCKAVADEQTLQVSKLSNLCSRTESFRTEEVAALRQSEQQARWEKHSRCSQLHDEKNKATQELHERLGLSLDSLLRVQQKRAETAAVLGIVTNESKSLLSQKQSLLQEKEQLSEQRNSANARFNEMMAQKHA